MQLGFSFVSYAPKLCVTATFFSSVDELELPDEDDDDDAKVEEHDASESTRCTSRSGSWKEECRMLHPKQKKLEVELNQARSMRQ